MELKEEQEFKKSLITFIKKNVKKVHHAKLDNLSVEKLLSLVNKLKKKKIKENVTISSKVAEEKPELVKNLSQNNTQIKIEESKKPSKSMESCVKQVKKKGKDIGSAYAICNSSMKKAGKKAYVKK